MSNPILLSSPLLEGNEKKYVEEVLQSPYIAAGGTFLDRFEKAFTPLLDPHKLIALNSGTSAIHLALILLNVKEGDEVICQSFTFCASANPIVYLGAKPIFVDSEEDTWNMCPIALEEAIIDRMKFGKKPRAIIIVDLFGVPAKYDELCALSMKYEIPILEDAAESLGSSYKGKACGTFGEFGVFSFNGNKIISTGGGGALVSKNLDLLEKGRYLSTQAREKVHYFEHHAVGYNYRMGTIPAAIGLAQLETLDQKISQRRAVFANYQKMLDDFSEISFLAEPAYVFSNRWLTAIQIDSQKAEYNREDLRIALEKEQIESRYLWKPLHLQMVFKDFPYYGTDIAEKIYDKGLCLPSSSHLTMEDQLHVVKVIAALHQKKASPNV
ncbi:DegT/DnrJ/EryC1/StrS family aminotransferase [Belliella sp. DSM 107340]|uniref:DegT/DnrJ/EryC1/StrS family aminotransferase n=1 Tax=Belliella calami TaxID=2923436 RepID=A0ABS9UNX2_9BACT|nr:DegT/DnrJ/EryC1/StrS family aminotransferase [Belliella calami]MCH7398330.1 DegT/DnrJ/EryC1/StrS family aminotransferase [Belliella calami]